MICVQEITEWEDTTLNHVYFLTDDKSRMLAYVKSGTDTVFEFSKPLGFSASKRKFQPVENRWGYQPEPVKSKARTWQVPGSKGNTYTVEESRNGLTCTCSGFRFRGKCRHIEEVEELCHQH